MTGSDLNSSAKPWLVQQRTSKIVYQEFHDQVSQKHFSFQNTKTVPPIYQEFHLQVSQQRFDDASGSSIDICSLNLLCTIFSKSAYIIKHNWRPLSNNENVKIKFC